MVQYKPSLDYALPLELPVPTAGPAEPIIKWAGGKRSLVPDLLRLIPPRLNGRYYEPFLGGAAVYLALQPPNAVLGDANAELMELYETVAADPHGLMAALDRLQPDVQKEARYYEIRAQDPATLAPVERAARFIYLNKTCYNGLYRVNRQGRFNVPFGRYARPPVLYDRENLERVSALLRTAELRTGDFQEILHDAGPRDLVYLDPPYVPLTRTANFTSYTQGAFGEPEQRRLAETVHELTRRGTLVLLSNSDTPLVRDLYAGYHMEVVYAPRNINSDGSGRRRIPELAIRNYA